MKPKPIATCMKCRQPLARLPCSNLKQHFKTWKDSQLIHLATQQIRQERAEIRHIVELLPRLARANLRINEFEERLIVEGIIQKKIYLLREWTETRMVELCRKEQDILWKTLDKR